MGARPGFTLIECMVVVAILGIFLGFVVAGGPLALTHDAARAVRAERAWQWAHYRADCRARGVRFDADVDAALAALVPSGVVKVVRRGPVAEVRVRYRQVDDRSDEVVLAVVPGGAR